MILGWAALVYKAAHRYKFGLFGLCHWLSRIYPILYLSEPSQSIWFALWNRSVICRHTVFR